MTTLKANISGEERDRDNVGDYEGSPTLSQNLKNLSSTNG